MGGYNKNARKNIFILMCFKALLNNVLPAFQGLQVQLIDATFEF
jgi:hypothetical protein